MSKKVSYEDCLDFIENYLHIELLDFQKYVLRRMCEEQIEVKGGRAWGRTMINDAYNKYIARLYEKSGFNIPVHTDEELPPEFKNASWIKTTSGWIKTTNKGE